MRFIIAVTLVWGLAIYAQINPPCLTVSSKPAIANPPLSYCTKYNGIASCCENNMTTSYSLAQTFIPYPSTSTKGKCGQLMQDLVCGATCDPNTRDFHQPVPNPIQLEVCFTVCYQLYEACKDAVDSNGKAIMEPGTKRSEFCNKVENTKQFIFFSEPSVAYCYNPLHEDVNLFWTGLGVGLGIGGGLLLIGCVVGCCIWRRRQRRAHPTHALIPLSEERTDTEEEEEVDVGEHIHEQDPTVSGDGDLGAAVPAI